MHCFRFIKAAQINIMSDTVKDLPNLVVPSTADEAEALGYSVCEDDREYVCQEMILITPDNHTQVVPDE